MNKTELAAHVADQHSLTRRATGTIRVCSRYWGELPQ